MSRTTLRTVGTVVLLVVVPVVLLVVVLGVALWSQTGETDTARDGGTPAGGPTSQAVAPTPTADESDEPAEPGEPAEEVDPHSGLPWVEVAELTPEGRETLELIDAGGPFPYPGKDGSTFHNFEGLLPQEPRGYYAEYTVPTPGEDDRGARRIIVGDGGELYWTVDHYESFERIRR